MQEKNTRTGVVYDSEDTMNDDTPVGVVPAVQEGVTPSVVDMTIKMGKHNSLDDTTVPESFTPLSTLVNMAGKASGKSSYANITSKLSGKKVNVHTLFIPGGSMDGLDAMLENGPWFIQNNPLILKKWHPDENLLKEDVSTVLVWVKLYGLPVMTLSEDGLSAIATKLGRAITHVMSMLGMSGNLLGVHLVRLFGHIHEEYPKNKGAGEKKPVKMPSQTSRGVEPTIEVSNSNPFDVLNSVVNDVEFVTNEGTTNLVNNGATSSGSSFSEKIDKIERQICKGKLRLLDNDRNPLVPLGIMESDSEVEVVFNETANLRISTSGDSYPDNDDYDPYDDDMYENHDLSKHLQSICDDLDITVHDRKKK
ncbi:cytokinin dehydrogenase 3-like protein [Tanacetum coccineum]